MKSWLKKNEGIYLSEEYLMNIARACWEQIILANENLTWVILVTQDDLCIHKHNIYYPRGGTKAMKNSVPSISVPVININLHCSGEITNKSNRTASQYLSADSLDFLKRSEYDSSLVSPQSQSKITPAPAAASHQRTDYFHTAARFHSARHRRRLD